MEEKDSLGRTGTGEVTRQNAAASLQHNTGSDERSESTRDRKTLEGWRLFGVLSSLAFGLLLAVLETSITATALVSISNHFGNSVNATWVVLAYLLSYMGKAELRKASHVVSLTRVSLILLGFATIFARASDGIGRKETTIVAWVFFGAFSLGGGLAKTLNQLIAFRVLQGIGGSGLYAMIMVVGPEITPLNRWGAFSGMLGMTIATGSVLGPILGGLIATKSTWRWIYLFNTPCAVIGIAGMLLSWPRNKKAFRLSLPSLQRVDFFGAVLLLAASTLLVFALQEAGSPTYAWSSPVIVSTLVLSSVCWVAFFAWIAWLSLGNKTFRMRAILPLHVIISRPMGPAIVTIFLTGFPYFIAIINLPQRFQIVNGKSPIQAGVRLLPLLCSMALGSGLGGAVSSATKKNLTSHTLIAAACLILLGCGLMSTLPDGLAFPRTVYGYQFVLGLGIGLTFSSGTMMTTLANEPDDVAAAQGALSQARILGGSTGLATATIILNHKINVELTNVLDPIQLLNLERLLSSITSLKPSEQAAVATIYTEAFTEQMRVCTYLSAACVVVALATFQPRPASLGARQTKQETAGSESDSPS